LSLRQAASGQRPGQTAKNSLTQSRKDAKTQRFFAKFYQNPDLQADFTLSCISHRKVEHRNYPTTLIQPVTLKERSPATEGSFGSFGRFFAAEKASAAQNDK
jgi:hypothetical protein